MAGSTVDGRLPAPLTPSLALALILVGIAASQESGETPQCARHYCNTQSIVTGAEGAIRRANLSLDKVIVVARHGDRFIMSYTRLGRLTAPRLSCQLVAAAAANSTFKSEPSLASFQAAATAIGPVSDGSGGRWFYPRYPDAPLCGPAHLTPTGVQQLLRLGAYLRAAYVDRLGAGRLRVAEVTSTDYRRTYQSALALLHAIEGGAAFAADRAPIVIRRVAAEHQNLCALSNCSCPSLDAMRRRVNAEVAARGRRSDASHAEFVRRARRVLGARHARPDYPWKVALDFLMQFTCRERPLPCYRMRCFRPSHVDSLWDHLAHYFAELSTLPVFVRRSRIEMQPLLEDFARVLSGVDLPSGSGGIYLYLGHDSTLVPLAASLGLRIDSWPPYAARFVIELYSGGAAASAVYEERSPQRQRFVRFLYEGHDVTADIHVCKRPPALGGDSAAGLCPVERLLEFVHSNMRELGFTDWRSACDELQLDP